MDLVFVQPPPTETPLRAAIRDAHRLAEGIDRPQGGAKPGTMARRMVEAPFHFGHDAQGAFRPDYQVHDISGFHERVERVP